MRLDPDFSEFIECCVRRDVRFLVVGGYALAAHGHPRFTKDLDVWLWVDQENARRLVAALDDFGFSSLGLTERDFIEPGTVVQLGHPPKRIDLLTSIDGVDFDECSAKRSSGRLQDLADAEALTGDLPQEGEGPWDR
jgi:hypothetical protein